GEAHAQGTDPAPAPERRHRVLAAAPRSLAAPRDGLTLAFDARVVEQRVAGRPVAIAALSVGDGRQLVRRHVDRLGDGGGVALELLGLTPRQARLLLTQLAVERPRRERAMRDQLGARLTRDATRAAEVVGM